VTASKELYRRWIGEAWSKGNVDVLDDMNTPDFADHSGLPGVSPDTAGMKQFIAGLHAAFSEVAFTIEDMVAEGDRLVGRWVMRGTNTGSFNGMPPTGRPVTVSGFDLLRVEGDRFAEVWHVEDIAGMLQQLGVMPGPPSA
jgi:predicted ester cyclase